LGSVIVYERLVQPMVLALGRGVLPMV